MRRFMKFISIFIFVVVSLFLAINAYRIIKFKIEYFSLSQNEIKDHFINKTSLIEGYIIYYNSRNSTPPNNMNQLSIFLADFEKYNFSKTYIKEHTQDYWGNTIIFKENDDKISRTYYSAGQDEKFGTDDDLSHRYVYGCERHIPKPRPIDLKLITANHLKKSNLYKLKLDGFLVNENGIYISNKNLCLDSQIINSIAKRKILKINLNNSWVKRPLLELSFYAKKDDCQKTEDSNSRFIKWTPDVLKALSALSMEKDKLTYISANNLEKNIRFPHEEIKNANESECFNEPKELYPPNTKPFNKFANLSGYLLTSKAIFLQSSTPRCPSQLPIKPVFTNVKNRLMFRFQNSGVNVLCTISEIKTENKIHWVDILTSDYLNRFQESIIEIKGQLAPTSIDIQKLMKNAKMK